MYPQCFWSKCILHVSDQSISSMFLIKADPPCFWSKHILHVSDQSISSMFLIKVYPPCSWSKYILHVPFKVYPPCSFNKVHISSLFLIKVYPLCFCSKHISGTLDENRALTLLSCLMSILPKLYQQKMLLMSISYEMNAWSLTIIFILIWQGCNKDLFIIYLFIYILHVPDQSKYIPTHPPFTLPLLSR